MSEEVINLPSIYEQLEYLKSETSTSGAYAIDTGIKPNQNTGFWIDYNEVSDNVSNYQQAIFGARHASMDKELQLTHHQNGILRFNNTSYPANFNLGTRYQVSLRNRVFTHYDGTQTVLPDTEWQCDYNIHLFCLNNAGTLYQGGATKVYRFKLYDGDTLVRDFIPAYDTILYTPCMYDLVSQQAFYNQGSGRFLTDKDYAWNYPLLNNNYNLPYGFKKCVYLQSDGTQWIDTGVIPNNETGLLLKALRLNNADAVPFGAREGESIYVPRYSTKNKAMNYGWVNGITPFYYDKAEDLQYISCLNLYNDRLAKMLSLDTEWVGLLDKNLKTFTTQSLWLFSHNWEGSYDATYSNWGGRVYRAQITQGNTLIRDYVPCLDADNRPCMYDIIGGGSVEDNTYYNQSGGAEFTYCLEHQLPSDFIKLKYLESTGTQYIKTGYVPTNTTGLYVDCFNNSKVTSSAVPMGLRDTNGNTYFTSPRTSKNSDAGYGWGTFTSWGGKGDVRFEGTTNWLNDRKAIITSPAFAQKVASLSDLPFTTTKDIYIFGIHNYDGNYLSNLWKFYRAKISEGSEIIRDFVPALDTRLYKPCMYDLINNVAYYNDGTGEFLFNRDFEGTYKGFTGLGCIGNRLGTKGFYEKL